ncbi:MAG TPA: M48 family metallopeptidase [Rudaea sp.]|nr:M48 family metallopeptidase [Rudaea sp.]
MNFFAQQERARKHTKRMLVLFALAVICIVVAVDLVLIMAFGGFATGRHHMASGTSALPQALLWSTLLVLAVIGFSSLYKVSSLRGGGSVVAAQMGATLVPPNTTDFARKRLHNVVEEIAIASGVPVPEVYVIEGEPAINAFAAGYTPSDAAVTVTEGCLQKLTRDELQGVIAHEFSHVLNGDMRLNIRLMGVLFGILVIGIIGRKLLSSSGRSRDSGNAAWFGIAILVIGYVGVFFGRLIKAGISRQREYLADASAVQFTRQTMGIGGALKKIGSLAEGSKLASSETEEVAHMLFGDGVGYSALFATHPPLPKRIKAIDPQFDPREFAAIAAAWSNPIPVGESDSADVSLAGFAPAMPGLSPRSTSGTAPIAAVAAAAAAQMALPQGNAGMTIDANKVAQNTGTASQDDIANAQTISNTIPERLRASAYMTSAAPQVVFALTLDTRTDIRERQLRIVEKYFDAETRAGVEALAGDVARLHPMQRLPLVQLAFPVLRRRPRPLLQTFLVALNEVVQADGTVAIEEYCLAKLIAVQVIDALDPSKARPTGAFKLQDCAAQLAQVIALVAEYGSDDPADAERAYLLGMNEVLPNAIPPYAPPEEWSLALDRGLPLLDRLVPAGKELLVCGLTRAIDADGVITVTEAELLRTICAAIHCPLPPILNQVA